MITPHRVLAVEEVVLVHVAWIIYLTVHQMPGDEEIMNTHRLVLEGWQSQMVDQVTGIIISK